MKKLFTTCFTHCFFRFGALQYSTKCSTTAKDSIPRTPPLRDSVAAGQAARYTYRSNPLYIKGLHQGINVLLYLNSIRTLLVNPKISTYKTNACKSY